MGPIEVEGSVYGGRDFGPCIVVIQKAAGQ